MAGRIASRVAKRREPAPTPSPSRRSTRQIQSPPMQSSRAGRATRSRSRDLSDGESVSHQPVNTRPARQSSVESTGSVNSVNSVGQGKESRTRKVTRAAPREPPIVEEDQDSDTWEEAQELSQRETRLERTPKSPGAVSNISGTTAHTSYSQVELADLDSEIMVDNFAGLYDAANHVLRLLTSSNTTFEKVERVVKELSVPGLPLARRLNVKEKAYDIFRSSFGSERYINGSYVNRKLFGDKVAPANAPRIDVIIQEANLATLLKTFLVAQRDSSQTAPELQHLDSVFPTPFDTQFATELEAESSEHTTTTLDLALEIRTQTVLSILKHIDKDEEPIDVLVQCFFEDTQQLSSFDEFIENGKLLNIAGVDLSQNQIVSYKEQILARVQEIHDLLSIREERGGLEYLHGMYPWLNFLTKMAQWSQLLQSKVGEVVESHGGAEDMEQNLRDFLLSSQDSASQDTDLPQAQQTMLQPSGKRTLQPPAEIIPASSGRKFQVSKAVLQRFVGTSARSGVPPPSNQQQSGAPIRLSNPAFASSFTAPETPLASSSFPTERASAPAKITEHMRTDQERRLQTRKAANNEFRPVEDFDDDVPPRNPRELVGIWHAQERRDNKENQPIKPRFVDKQANATRVEWGNDGDSQSQRQPATSQKRNHDTYVIDDDEPVNVDEDDDEDDFQVDQRTVDPKRRQQALIASARAAEEPVSKRAREMTAEELLEEYNRRLNEDAALQASTRATNDFSESEEEEDDAPPATYQEVKEQAKRNVAIAGQIAQTFAEHRKGGQGSRTRWSPQEENDLLRLIGIYGCKYALILKTAEGQNAFGDRRDEGMIRDKARNMKTDYLKTGSALPVNFDQVAIKTAQISSIKSQGLNPYRLVGELVGEETYDMDGNLIEGEGGEDDDEDD